MPCIIFTINSIAIKKTTMKKVFTVLLIALIEAQKDVIKVQNYFYSHKEGKLQ